MNWLDKYILNRADNIRKKQEAAKKAEDIIKTEISAKRKNIRERLQNIVKFYANELDKQPTHINVDDEVVLNIYNLVKYARNGWDGGPSSLAKLIKDKEAITGVPEFVIKDIYVDFSLSNERIENYIDSIDDRTVDFVFKQIDNSLESLYKTYCSKRESNPCFDLFGLYKTATFTSSYKFQPNWGLNVNSFLKKDSPAGKQTIKIYHRQLKESAIRKKISDYAKETEEMIKKASQKYPV